MLTLKSNLSVIHDSRFSVNKHLLGGVLRKKFLEKFAKLTEKHVAKLTEKHVLYR